VAGKKAYSWTFREAAQQASHRTKQQGTATETDKLNKNGTYKKKKNRLARGGKKTETSLKKTLLQGAGKTEKRIPEEKDPPDALKKGIIAQQVLHEGNDGTKTTRKLIRTKKSNLPVYGGRTVEGGVLCEHIIL